MMLISSPPCGAVLGLPQLAGDRIPGQPLRIAVAVAPDRRHRARRVDERIVLRHRAVVVDAVDLAERLGEILRVRHVVLLAEREEQVPLLVEDEARSVVRVRRAVELGLRAEDDLLLGPLVVLVDLAADDDRHRRRIGRTATASATLRGGCRRGRRCRIDRRGGRRREAGQRLGIGEIDPAVARVLRVDLDVEHPAVLLLPDLGRTFHRVRQQGALVDDAKAARTLGDEQPAVRQERQGPTASRDCARRYRF